MNALQLHEFALSLFQKRNLLLPLHQELSEHFYPERADFMFQRQLGDEFAEYLMTSYPIFVRRELADAIGSMLRPAGQQWFRIGAADPERETQDARQWLEFAAAVQRRAMYDPAAMMSRATKEGDNDFATFGMCALSSEIVWDDVREGPHLLHRTWHLRDMAWCEDRFGKVGSKFRKWRPTARELFAIFGNKVSKNVSDLASGTGIKPLTEIDVMHMVVERDLYDIAEDKVRDKPWVSIFYDARNKQVIEEVPQYSPYYVIPRWQTVSGSAYAYSPASIVGLPDARLLQAMTRTLIEAGEKAANPPMVATDDVVRGDVAIYAGGITYVDRDYDERLGDALRPLTQDFRGMPIGMDMHRDARSMLFSCFYLNKLNMPERAPEMTAYEVSQRVQQYIRQALPLFEPMESDYNGQLCELDFDLLRRAGAFGSPWMIPRSLQGARTSFSFVSPLHDAIESQKTGKFLEMGQLLAQAVQMDKNAAAIPDAVVAFRDALAGAGIPAKWTRPEYVVQQMRDAAEQQQRTQELMQGLLPASEAALNLGKASKTAAELGGVTA